MLKLKSRPSRAKQRSALLILLLVLIAGLLIEHSHSIREEDISSWSEAEPADCAVVLTGGPGRIREGVALLQREQVRTLIISGVHPDALLQDLLTPWEALWGIPEAQIVLEKNARTTYGNAAQSLPLVEALRCRDLFIVTSQFHMFRAFKTFKAQFPKEIQLRKYAIPSSRSESSWMGYWTEVLKSVFYSIWAY